MATSKAAAASSSPEPVPSLGRIVHYRLSVVDADAINAARERARWAPRNEWGFQAPVGNYVAAGNTFPAVVVRTNGGNYVNLQVLLDGNDQFWATSRGPGAEAGTWSWPPEA